MPRRRRRRRLQIRFLRTFIDAYEGEGWRKGNADKSRPEAELLSNKRLLLQCKRRVRETLAEIGEAADGARSARCDGRDLTSSGWARMRCHGRR